MLDIIKIIAIGLLGTFLALTVKQQKPEIALGIALATGVVIFTICIDALSQVIDFVKSICAQTGLDYVYLTLILKIIGVSYLTQLSSAAAADCGQSSIATKIDFAGKMCIIIISIPILQGLLNLLVGLIQ